MMGFKFLTFVLVGSLVTVEVAGDESLVSLLMRILAENKEEPSCSSYYKGNNVRASRSLKTFVRCNANTDCVRSELCCPTPFFSVCVEKVFLVKNQPSKPAPPPPPPSPPPSPEAKPLDDAPPDVCASLPRNSLVARGLSELADMLQKRNPLIQATSCAKINTQDNCSQAEICCKSPLGHSCYPLSDTSAGSQV